jgi:PKD repeat protein
MRFQRVLRIVILLVLVMPLSLEAWSNAGPNRQAISGKWVTLDGSGSKARKGYTKKRYEWYYVRGPRAQVKGTRSAKLSVLAPEVSRKTTIVYKLRLVERHNQTGKWTGTNDYVGITVYPKANKAPQATIGVSSSHIIVGDSVAFDGGNSVDSDGSIVKYEWSREGEVLSTQSSFTYNFTTEGTYTITLTVQDNKGAKHSVSKTVQVIANEIPEALADVSQSSGVVGESITFDGSTSSDGDGEIVSYEWQSNGVVLSRSEKFTHTFGSTGEHVVTLVVKDDRGAMSSTEVKVTLAASHHDLLT